MITSSFEEDQKTSVDNAFKAAFDEMRINTGEETADIVRTIVTEAGLEHLGQESVTAEVAGLSGKEVLVQDFSQSQISLSGGLIQVGDKKFVFYDLTIYGSDTIRYSGKDYGIVQKTENSHGRVEVQGRLGEHEFV